MRSYRWNFADSKSELVAQVAQRLRISPLLAQCLLNRGCSDCDNASAYLQPRLAQLSDPFLLPQMEAAVERLIQARATGEPLVIFGDYDVDGVTATALLTEFFGRFGWKSTPYLPHRLEEGYGLCQDAVQNCLARYPVKLVLAVDCGTSSVDVISGLRARGIDVLVLDHHQPGSTCPPAKAVVNPHLLRSHLHLKNLCSAGLAFKLAHALLKRGRQLNWPDAFTFDLKSTLDLVALGTIADMVPLTEENRIFARVGLERITSSRRAGIQALKEVAGVQGQVTAQEVSFQLAPRLNAAGRLETASSALELLLTSDQERAAALARGLNEQNRERQTVEKRIVESVLADLRRRFDPARDFAIVEGDSNWHLGVVGIVASRVLREFHRPVFILGSDGPDHFRGSGRSIDGFDMAAGLRECSSLLLKHGGHAMAAGVTLARASLSDFRARLNSLVQSQVSSELLHPALRLDAEVTLRDLDFECLRSFVHLDPLGQGNPPVQLAARGLRICGEVRRLGGEGQHARFTVADGHTSQQAIWWNCQAELEIPADFDLAFVPELNSYNGTIGIQLKVLDLKPRAT